jgi:hypothetical protein
MLKDSLWESFDAAQDERRAFAIIEDFPFMLGLSKHSEPFFCQPAGFPLCPGSRRALGKDRMVLTANLIPL